MAARPDISSLIHQALLGDALESATGFGAFVLDEHGRYVAVNDFACELCGYERDELAGLEIGAFNPHLVHEYAAALEQRRYGGTTFIVRKDGTSVELHYRAGETRLGAMPFLVVLCWPAEPR